MRNTHHPDQDFLAFTSIQPMRWGDMDALGHINNTLFFRYMEQARCDWIYQFGGTLDPNNIEGFVVINAQCTFLRQLTFPGQVRVNVWLGEVGRSSVMSYYELHKINPNGELDANPYATGAAKMVWVHYAEGKSRPLPDFVRAYCVRPNQ